jgi:hypothetical protein
MALTSRAAVLELTGWKMSALRATRFSLRDCRSSFIQPARASRDCPQSILDSLLGTHSNAGVQKAVLPFCSLSRLPAFSRSFTRNAVTMVHGRGSITVGVAAIENLVLSADRVDTDEGDMHSADFLKSEGASTSGRETQPAPEIKERVRFCAWRFLSVHKL